MEADFVHKPVMLQEVIDWLCIKKRGIYVDGTVGGGGHAWAILQETEGDLIGLDCDEDALAAAEKRLAEFGSRKTLLKANFSELGKVLKDLHVNKVDGVLLDLGVSSLQLDRAERGFSFNQPALLDMRMDRSLKLSAYDIVNSFAQKDLEKIIRNYGEERMAARIARAITKKRQQSPLRTTAELADLVFAVMPAKYRHQKISPATRTFQAIRIAVNDELGAISPAINSAVAALNKGGRVVVISFHSLEDNIVKNEFRSLSGACSCPKNIPFCLCRKDKQICVLTRKALMPKASEIESNPRARSAKMRVAERI